MNSYVKEIITRCVVAYTMFWARLVLRRRRPIIIGITGSVGKTTTKEIIGSALMHQAVRPCLGLVWKTSGNMNDRKGLPLVVLGYTTWMETPGEIARRLCTMPFRALWLMTVSPYPRYMVLEYALGRVTTLRQLAEVAPPTVAIVTAVGPAHLERDGGVDAVAANKSDLVAAVPPNGLVLLAADNRYAAGMEVRSRAPVRKLPGRGRELAQAMARIVGEYLGVEPAALERALADHVAVPGRQQLLNLGGIRVVNDAFNANPLSMDYGLEMFATQARPGERRVAVLGEMGQLGSDGPRYHRETAAAARRSADVVIGVGPLAKYYDPDHWYATSTDCAKALPALLRAGDFVFVKGSAFVGLGRIANVIRELAPRLTVATPETAYQGGLPDTVASFAPPSHLP